jgi:hypothetical protein
MGFTAFNSLSLQEAVAVMGRSFTWNESDFIGVRNEIVIEPEADFGGVRNNVAFSYVVPISQFTGGVFPKDGEKIRDEFGHDYKIVKFDRDEISFTIYVTDLNR